MSKDSGFIYKIAHGCNIWCELQWDVVGMQGFIREDQDKVLLLLGGFETGA